MNDFVILIDRSTSFDLYKKIFEYLGIPMSILKEQSLKKDYDVLVLKNLLKLLICIKNKDFSNDFKYCFISIARSFLYRLDDNVIKFMTIKVSKVAEKVEDRNTMKLQRGEIYSYEDGLKQRVQEKITNEYNDFIEELKKERPEVIIERAYEKVCKEEMLYVFEKNDLSVNECKSLLKCSNILDDCYSEWLKSDGNFNEMLEYAVENSIEHITEDFKREQKQKNKDSR